MKYNKRVEAEQKAAKAQENWMKSFHENPEQTQEVVRNMLRSNPSNVKLVEASLRGPVRWTLKRKGALDIVKQEIREAKEYWKTQKS